MSENNQVTNGNETGFDLWLFIKIGAFLLFLYGVGRYLWDNYIRAWWNGSAPEGLKVALFWVALLSITSFVYNVVKSDESN